MSTDDSNLVILAFGPDNDDYAASNRANCDEAVLELGMRFVKDFEDLCSTLEELPTLLKGNAMLPEVGTILRFVPTSLAHREYTPMAESVNGC